MKAWIVWVLALVAACATPSTPPEGSLEPTVADTLAQLEATPPPPIVPDAKVWHRRPASDFVPASPDTRSQKDIEAAACWGFEDGHKAWRCTGKPPQTFMAGASSPIIPSSWTVPAWYFDPANSSGVASDQNSCTSAGAPCLTWGEVQVHRWGCGGSPRACPRQRQNTTRNWMSSQSGNSDPVYDFPTIEAGVSITHTGVLPAAASSVCGVGSVLANVTNLNRGTNLQLAQVNLSGGGACTLTVGQLLVNATHPSRAWVYKNNAGSVWQFSAPNNSNIPASNPAVATVAWANGDAVTVYTPPSVDIVAIDPIMADWNGSFSNGLLVTDLKILDPSGPGNDPVLLGKRVFGQDFGTDREALIDGTGTDGGPVFANGYFSGGGIEVTGSTNPFSGAGFFGGVIGSAFIAPVSSIFGSFNFDQDVIIKGTLTANGLISNPGTNSNFASSIGLVYVETGGNLFLTGNGVMWSTVNGSHVPIVYGPGTTSFIGGANYKYPTGAGGAAATFKTTTFQLGQGATKFASQNLANAAPWTGNLTTSVANIDTALGATSGCAMAAGAWLCNSGTSF